MSDNQKPNDGYNDATRPYVFKPGQPLNLGWKKPWSVALFIYVVGWFALLFFVAMTTLGWGLLYFVYWFPLIGLVGLGLLVMSIIEWVRGAKKTN